jgi:hypothetical protein
MAGHQRRFRAFAPLESVDLDDDNNGDGVVEVVVSLDFLFALFSIDDRVALMLYITTSCCRRYSSR